VHQRKRPQETLSSPVDPGWAKDRLQPISTTPWFGNGGERREPMSATLVVTGAV
jgi:hypothetical protein